LTQKHHLLGLLGDGLLVASLGVLGVTHKLGVNTLEGLELVVEGLLDAVLVGLVGHVVAGVDLALSHFQNKPQQRDGCGLLRFGPFRTRKNTNEALQTQQQRSRHSRPSTKRKHLLSKKL